MDLDEWELLPHDGFLDYHEDGEKKSLALNKRSSNPKSMFDMNYFMCPSSPPKNSRVVPNQVVPLTIQLEPITTTTSAITSDEKVQENEVTKVPVDMSLVPAVIKRSKDEEADQDSVSQVFFKKMKENEFVDMKVDSPKSATKGFAPPQIDTGSFNFEQDKSHEVLEAKITSPRIKNNTTERESVKDHQVIWEDQDQNSGLNLWKWSLTGIGAICSFGVAAATICIIIFGSHQKSMKQQENQKLRFQIYTDDKRIKEVVQHATMSAVRGVPISRAHITYGGYYDAL